LRRRVARRRRPGQGVEAQSVANCYTATSRVLEVVPVINKIDLTDRGPRTRDHARSRTSSASRAKDALRISAKTGEASKSSLERIVERIRRRAGSERRRCRR